MFAPLVPQAQTTAAARSPGKPLGGRSTLAPWVRGRTVDDPLEHEADRIASRVISLPSSGRSGTAASPEAAAGVGPSKAHPVPGAQGQPLDAATRAFFEPRFGHDFSRVRVHADAAAGASARRAGALAYAAGNDLFFAPGRYAPHEASGRRLLAHELTHVVQQDGGSSGRIPVQATARDLQCAVSTLGGDWDATPTYEVYNDGTQDSGVTIDRLHFAAKDPVNATKIGLTQKVTPVANGSPSILPHAIGRAIPSGEPDSGSYIDRLPNKVNPIYGMNDPAGSGGLASSVPANNAEWGFHFKGGDGKTQHQDATLSDQPTRPGHGPNSSQLFETVALAVEGPQAGTAYGSVRWGWRSDASNKVTKEPLSVVSLGVPSAAFRRAAELWNASKTTTGAAVLPLPAMHAPQPQPGTEATAVEEALAAGDYATAYQIINGQWIKPMLPTLSQLNKKGLLPALYSNTDQAVGVDTPRLRVAIEAVQFKESKVPLSQEFSDWIDPSKNPRTGEINEIKAFIGMK